MEDATGKSYGLVIYDGEVFRSGGPDNDACTSWRLIRKTGVKDEELFVGRDNCLFVKAPWDETAKQLASVARECAVAIRERDHWERMAREAAKRASAGGDDSEEEIQVLEQVVESREQGLRQAHDDLDWRGDEILKLRERVAVLEEQLEYDALDEEGKELHAALVHRRIKAIEDERNEANARAEEAEVKRRRLWDWWQAAKADRDRLADALRGVEWSGATPPLESKFRAAGNGHVIRYFCPACGGSEPTHRPGCAVDDALTDTPSEPKPCEGCARLVREINRAIDISEHGRCKDAIQNMLGVLEDAIAAPEGEKKAVDLNGVRGHLNLDGGSSMITTRLTKHYPDSDAVRADLCGPITLRWAQGVVRGVVEAVELYARLGPWEPGDEVGLRIRVDPKREYGTISGPSGAAALRGKIIIGEDG